MTSNKLVVYDQQSKLGCGAANIIKVPLLK
jgi:hypothetical protein